MMICFMAVSLAVKREGLHVHRVANPDVKGVHNVVHARGTRVQWEEIVMGERATVAAGVVWREVEVEEQWRWVTAIDGVGCVCERAIFGIDLNGLVDLIEVGKRPSWAYGRCITR